MTFKCPWVPAKLCDQQGSLLYQAKSTYEAEQQLLYTLFLYYTYYFDCLTRIKQLASTYALQDNVPQIYERYYIIASRGRLSLLAHGPNPCHFLLNYLHYVNFISYYHDTYYFKNKKRLFGCVFIAENLLIGTSTTGVSEHTHQEHKGLNHQAPRSLLPRWHLAQPAHRTRSRGCTRAIQCALTPQLRLEPIAQCIDGPCNGSMLFLPDVICNSEFNLNQ